MRDPGSIVITGASSGIGEALTLFYARSGVRLVLTGRDAGRLASVCERARNSGADVVSHVVDVADREAMASMLTAEDARCPVDLVIANAGISAGTGGAAEGGLGETEEQARRIMAINVDGVLNTIHPLIPLMAERGRGQIAIMSSLAAFRGIPGAPAYSASKAAVRLYGEALRVHLAQSGIQVSVICPGYVVSRITDANSFPMPFLMETERAARIIGRGLHRNRGRIIFPWPMAFAVWLLALMPTALTDPLLARAPRKSAGG